MAAEAAQVVVPPAVQLQPLRLPDDAGALVAFITGQDWPFHFHLRPSTAQVQAWIAADAYAPPGAQAFWIVVDGECAGFTRLFDLEDIADGEPQFDLRVGAAWRGRGVAQAALRALCDHAFGTWPPLARISAETRVDNLAMRRVLVSCGFVLEGQFRRAWDSDDGARHDALWFGLLRDDWASGVNTPVRWVDEAGVR